VELERQQLLKDRQAFQEQRIRVEQMLAKGELPSQIDLDS